MTSKEYKLEDYFDQYKIPEPSIKNAGQEEILQFWQIEEIKKCQRDPVYFANTYCWVKGEGGIGKYKAREYQEEMFEDILKYDNTIFLFGRQSGKTISTAIIILHQAIFGKSDSDFLCCCHIFNQAVENVTKIKDIWERLPDWLKPGVIDYNKQSVKFENRNRIIARPTTPTAATGMSLSGILFLDEFAKVASNLQQEFYSSVIPTLSAARGKIVICSTPQSDFDLFSNIWNGSQTFIDSDGNELDPNGPGVNGFKGLKVTYEQIPGRDEEWKKKEIAKLGGNELMFLREYCCMVIGTEGTLIDGRKINELSNLTKFQKPLRTESHIRWFKELQPFDKYIVALDPATGVEGSDYACIQILKYPDLEQIGEMLSSKIRVEEQTRILYKVLKELYDFQINNGNYEPDIWYTFERNAIGEGVRVEMDNMINNDDVEFPGVLISDKNSKGMVTTNSTKGFGCTILKQFLETDKLKIHSKELVRQLSYFVKLPGSNNFKAKEGEHDDAVMAMVLACRIIDKIKYWDDDIIEDTYDSIESSYEAPMMPVFGTTWS